MSTPQVSLIGLQALGGPDLELLAFGFQQRDAELSNDLRRNLRLHIEDVFEDPIVGLGPDLTVVGGADQLRCDPDSAAVVALGPGHGAVENIFHVQL